MRSSGLQSAPDTPGTSGFSGQGRHAHIRLSKLRAWKLPNSRGRMCRTCVHSPAMQAESAVNAVATPTEAPTWPPWVASSAGLAQVSGAHEPAMVGSQLAFSHPLSAALQPLLVLSKQVGKECALASQLAFSHPVINFLQPLLVLSKQVGKECALASQLAFSQPVSSALHPLFVLSK